MAKRCAGCLQAGRASTYHGDRSLNGLPLATDGLFVFSTTAHTPFVEFGAWTLSPEQAWPKGGILLAGSPKENRKLVRHAAPLAPGVYGMIDVEGELLYIGQSRSLRNRLLSYFATSPPGKAGRIAGCTQRLVWETAPDEFAALLRELELIRRWRPRFNVRGQPGRRRPAYLVVSRGPGSRLYLARKPVKGDRAVFGPVRASRTCQRAVHALNDFFQLRTCGQQVPMHFSEQRVLFESGTAALCARHALGICLGPCASNCSRDQYSGRVRALKRFLRGTDGSVLSHLEQAMLTAAEAMRYEEAAIDRDRWEAVTALDEQLERFRTAQRDYSFIYPLPNGTGGHTWYFIRAGDVVAAATERRRALALIDEVYGADGIVKPDDVEVTLLVAGWFRSRPEEMLRTVLPKECLDSSGALTLLLPSA